MVGRLAGDDFLIVVEGPDAALAAANVAKCVTDTIKHSPLIVDGRSVFLGASVGVAIGHSDEHSVNELLVNADLALDAAKESRNSYCVYTPSLRNAH